MPAAQAITDDERRARLARRHRLAPGHRAADVVEATESMVCLHGTDPATVFLSAWARIGGFTRDDLHRALYEERSLVKHMAMRRTVWVVPRAILPAVQAFASTRVAGQERRRLVKEVEKHGLVDDGATWLDGACRDVVAFLADREDAKTAEIREGVGSVGGATHHGEGKSWGGAVPIAPRVITVLSAEGAIFRAHNDGAWNVSRHRWATTERWLGAPIEPRDPAEAETRLVEAWLRAFGPGTELDVKWWLGGTLGGVRKALAALEAVEVTLEGGGVGYVLPDDVEPVAPVDPWGALLPPLDPTTMGWFERAWYLGPYKSQLFDLNGNAGPTAWWDGRIVGGWRQHASGEVELQLLEDVGAEARAVLDAEAARLTVWFEGVRTLPRFPSPLSKAVAEQHPESAD